MLLKGFTTLGLPSQKASSLGLEGKSPGALVQDSEFPFVGKQHSKTPWLIVLLLSLVLVGCSCQEDDSTSAFGPRCGDEMSLEGQDGQGFGTGLLVSDAGRASLRRFTDFTTLESNVETSSELTGGLTQLVNPGYLVLQESNTLVVPDSGAGAIYFYSNLSNLEGNQAPDRILRGPATLLSRPSQCFLGSGDELYVLNSGSSQVLVFSNASAIEGDVAPERRIGGPNSAISNPVSFSFDRNSEVMTVANPSEVLNFSAYRSAEGDPPPLSRLSGPQTQFGTLSFVQRQTNGTLILADSGGRQILFFENYDVSQNGQAPDRILGGSNTGLSSPGQFLLSGDALYVANGSNILAFEAPASLEGNPFPDRQFSGLNPTPNQLRGMVVLNP